jgi:hypothetical protein
MATPWMTLLNLMAADGNAMRRNVEQQERHPPRGVGVKFVGEHLPFNRPA